MQSKFYSVVGLLDPTALDTNEYESDQTYANKKYKKSASHTLSFFSSDSLHNAYPAKRNIIPAIPPSQSNLIRVAAISVTPKPRNALLQYFIAASTSDIATNAALGNVFYGLHKSGPQHA